MLITDATKLRAILIADCAAAGAPGTFIQGATGVFNPVHELLGSFANAAAPLIDNAAALAFWTLAALPYPGTIPVLATSPVPGPLLSAVPIRPTSSLTQPNLLAAAQLRATQLGWTGTHRSVLFHGVYRGLHRAFASSLSVLGTAVALDPFAPALYTYVAPPIPATAVRAATVAAFLANPHLGAAGDPSRRVLLAGAFGQILSHVWSSVTPQVTVGLGVTPAVTIPVVYTP